MIFSLLPAVYFGWGLGSNDAANIFGPPVTSGLIKYKKAIILAAIFVLLGALLEGSKCFSVLGRITSLDFKTAFVATFSAAIVLHLMTTVGFPISASQAIIGAIIGIGLLKGNPINYGSLIKVILCWIVSPLGAAIIAIFLFNSLAYFYKRRVKNLSRFDSVIKISCVIAVCYGAYNLGANNVANIAGTFVASGILSPFLATLIGGISIGLGILTYSKRVMFTVGKKIAPLDPFSAFIAILAEALTLHIFTQIGVPVSSSHVIVGAITGIGLARGARMVNRLALFLILGSWIATLLLTALFSYGLGHLVLYIFP